MILWRDRIRQAKQRRSWVSMRGFDLRDRIDAGDWRTCAVGEQVSLGRLEPRIQLHDSYVAILGRRFSYAVSLAGLPLIRPFAVRWAERLYERIENYALETDLARASKVGATGAERPQITEAATR